MGTSDGHGVALSLTIHVYVLGSCSALSVPYHTSVTSKPTVPPCLFAALMILPLTRSSPRLLSQGRGIEFCCLKHFGSLTISDGRVWEGSVRIWGTVMDSGRMLGFSGGEGGKAIWGRLVEVCEVLGRQ